MKLLLFEAFALNVHELEMKKFNSRTDEHEDQSIF